MCYVRDLGGGQVALKPPGSSRDLVSIEPKHIRDWLNKKLSHLANGTQRHYLHPLSGLYRYAQELGVVPACGASERCVCHPAATSPVFRNGDR